MKMERKTLTYISSKVLETNMFPKTYYIFFCKEEGRKYHIKKNKILSYISKFIEGEEYVFFLQLGCAMGVSHNDTLFLAWGGCVIRKDENGYKEMNTQKIKSPSTEEQLKLYVSRFFESNGVSL